MIYFCLVSPRLSIDPAVSCCCWLLVTVRLFFQVWCKSATWSSCSAVPASSQTIFHADAFPRSLIIPCKIQKYSDDWVVFCIWLLVTLRLFFQVWCESATWNSCSTVPASSQRMSASTSLLFWRSLRWLCSLMTSTWYCPLSCPSDMNWAATDRLTQRWFKKNHLRMYLWWILHAVYLHACQVRVTIGDSGLCCVCVTSFER